MSLPCAVVVEADFPDAFRANLYARGLSQDKSADEALGEFKASQHPALP